MEDTQIFLYILIGALVIVVINVRVFWSFQKSKRKIEAQEHLAQEKLYEIAVLKELEERVGYSLHIEKIVNIVLGSLRQFVDYTTAAYMLIEGPRILFYCDLNSSINRAYLDDVRSRMLNFLKNQAGVDTEKTTVVESLAGAILVDDLQNGLKSYYEIPIKIKSKVIGVLAVSSIKTRRYEQETMAILQKIVGQTELAVTKFQQALDLEKGKISSMVESMTDGVIMTDRESHIVVANPAAKAVIGAPVESEVTIFDFIESLSGTFDIRGRLEESIALKKLVMVPDTAIHGKFYKIFVSPVRNILNKEEILGGVVLFHDISKEKEVEQMRDDFTSMIVHDLRAPLDGIQKMISVIQGGAPKEDSEKYFGMINRESGAMLDLVNSLLDIAKLESGKFELYLEDGNLKELIDEKVEYYSVSAKKRNIGLSANLAADMPEKMRFDAVRVGRVITNLISNAMKFTPDAGRIVIDAFVHQQGKNIFKEALAARVKWLIKENDPKIANLGNSVIVTITDNGCGIKESDLEVIFEKFRQSSNKGEGEKKGTGLGLTVARGIIEAHGGVLDVASRYAEGTTFWFNLPFNRPELRSADIAIGAELDESAKKS